MKKIRKNKLTAIIAVIFLLINQSTVFADQGTEKASEGADYTIEPVKSRLQMNNKAGYFHLDVNENTKEKLMIEVHNNSDKEQKFKIRKGIAKTNRNGLIVYDDANGFGPNDSLKLNIEELLTIKKDIITVPARSSGAFEIELSMNQKKFDGIILGAFTVEKLLEDTNNSGIDQIFMYELGIVLNQNNDSSLPNSKTLELGNVEVKLNEGRKILSYEIENLEPQIARNLNFETTLTKTDINDIIFDEKVENYSIAPNGTLPLSLDWKKKELLSGRYKLEIKATDGEEKWYWEHDFTVDEKKADQLNTETLYKLSYPRWTRTVIIILGLLTVLNTIYLVRREIKENKEHRKVKE